MLFNFKRPLQVCFKPADVKKFKFNRASFSVGLKEVSQEVLEHPYFKKAVMCGWVEEVGRKDFKVDDSVVKAKAKGTKTENALKKASSAIIPEGFEYRDADAIKAEMQA